MPNLQKYEAKLCYVAVGFLIHNQKVLLVHHKKTNFWLAPGGHIEPDELPHQAAEREFFEETGIRVTALSSVTLLPEDDSEYVPTPFAINLHWVSKTNYTVRQNSPDSQKRVDDTVWTKGCEQHVGFLYCVKPIDSVAFVFNEQETHNIQWFAESEVDSLDSTNDIKSEIHTAFEIARK